MGARQRQAVAEAAEMVVQRLEERRMLSATMEDGVWTIDADNDRDHVISIDISPGNPLKIKATMDGKILGSVLLADLDWVEINGGAGNDRISFNVPGRNSEVDVYAGAGNDTIMGGGGDDYLYGEGGDDSIVGGGGNDFISGDEGKDTIDGGKGDDEIHSDEGDDQIDGGGGDDTIYAGSGDDDVSGEEGDDDIWGGWGDDDIEGDGGDDDISGGKGDDDLDGGDGGDDLSGGSGHDELIGAAGDDELDGQAGADTLAGGLGEDSLKGGDGADQEHGGFDDDVIKGQNGNDTIWGGEGTDTLSGGANQNTVYNEEDDQIVWGRFDTSKDDQLVNPLHKVNNDEQFKQWLIDRAVANYRWLLASNTYRTWYTGDAPYSYPYYGNVYYRYDSFTTTSVTLSLAGNDVAEVGRTITAKVSNSDHSETNTQEQGVDEADLVKTDGDYIYLISNSQVLILDAQPAEQTKVVSAIDVGNGYASGLYLDGDRLTVIRQAWESMPVQQTDDAQEAVWLGYTYRSYVMVTVYDVSDHENPTVAEETEINGYLNSSREVDGRLYLVVSNSLNLPRPLALKVGDPVELAEGRYWPGRQEEMYRPVDFVPEEGAEDKVLEWQQWGQKYRYETEAEFRARLEGMSIGEILPGYTVDAGGDTILGGLAGQIYAPDDPNKYVYQMSSVVLLNLKDNQPGPEASTTIFGMQGQVYASTDNLYVTTQVWETPMGGWRGELRTDIYKFELGEHSVDFHGSGEVPGWAINSFAMDDEGDYFRIATTSSQNTGNSNNVFVLKENGEQLEVVGGITGLAFSERIFAARFIGDKGYLVTFRSIDPLFTIDFSDPENPSVVGQLKVPGFSTYLHPVDEGHLLAIGHDGGNLQVSLFDVTDMKHPRRLSVFTIGGGWGASSAAEYDHHAFSYFPAQHILALPVWSWNGGGQSTVLLNVDLEKGLSKAGVISLGWGWGEQRTVRIGQFIYAIGAHHLKIVSLLSPEHVVQDIELGGTDWVHWFTINDAALVEVADNEAAA